MIESTVVDCSDDFGWIIISRLVFVLGIDFDDAVIAVRWSDESDMPLNDAFNVLSTSCDDEREDVEDEFEEVDENDSSEDDDERLNERKIISHGWTQTRSTLIDTHLRFDWETFKFSSLIRAVAERLNMKRGCRRTYTIFQITIKEF